MPSKGWESSCHEGFCVYEIVRLETKASYIGMTDDWPNRLHFHLRDAFEPRDDKDRNHPISVAIREHGMTAFAFLVRQTGIPTREEAKELELQWIAKRKNAGREVYNKDGVSGVSHARFERANQYLEPK